MNTIKGKHAELRLYLQLAWLDGCRTMKIRIDPEMTKIGILTSIHNLVSVWDSPESLIWVKLFIALNKETYTLTLQQNLPEIEQGDEIIRFTNLLPFADQTTY